MISDNKEPKQRNGKRARFRTCDIEAIARLVTTRKMTETEACITLGFRPQQWQCWKSRAKRSAEFETIIARTRGAMVDGLVSKIEQAGDDQEIILPNGKVINKRGDWRAPAWLLEKTAPQFRPDNGTPAPPQVTVQIGIIHEQLKRVIGFEEPAPKQIAMPTRNNK